MSIREDAASGDPVANGIVSAIDPEGDAITYSIVDLSNSFTVDPQTGALTLTAPALDFENTSSFAVTLIATDTGSGTQTVLPVEIFVSNVNEAPTLTPIPATIVPEDTPVGSTVANAVGTDIDGDALSYSITDGTGQGVFTIDADTGEITLAQPLDFETTATYTLTVQVTDAGTPAITAEQVVSVTIADANDAPIVTPGQSVGLGENTAAGTLTLDPPIAATDADGDALTFSLADPGGYVTIDPATGEIVRTAKPLNHEATPTLTVTVTATDPGGATGSAPVTVNVIDRNDTPVITPLAGPLSTPENQTTAVIGSIIATDEDGDALTYALTGPGASNFALAPNGDIRVTTALDFETTSSYNLTATVTDSAIPGATASIPVDIVVTDKNEAPVVTPAQVFAIGEQQPAGTTVVGGPAQATDVDGDALTYVMTDVSGTFEIDPATGAISSLAALDFETVTSYPITIIATDGDGLTSSEPAKIEVLDLNEPPSITGPAIVPVVLAENRPIGHVVTADISALDPESDTLTFTLTSDPSGLFAVDPTTGAVTVAVEDVDAEDAASHTITVTVDDSSAGPGTGSDATTFAIAITDENESPEITTVSLPITPEDTAVGSLLDTLAATDPEGDGLTWSVTGGPQADAIAIDPSTGAVTLARPLDFESGETSLTFDVQATDGDLSDVQTFTVVVADVNEPLQIVAGQVFAIDETASIGEGVGAPTSVAFTDPENDPATTWSINDPTGTFTIDATSGQISYAANTLDADGNGAITTYVVDVTAVGTPTTPSTESVTIEVLPVNENPTITAPTTLDVVEDRTPGIVGAFSVDNPENEPLTFEATGTTGPFAVDQTDGTILLQGPLDHESVSSYTFTVTVADTADLTRSSTTTLTINVLNVNEVPVFDTTPAFTIEEDSIDGTIVTGQPTASDPDGTTPTFSITDPTNTFIIDPMSGQVALDVGPIDADAPPSDVYPVDVTISDNDPVNPLTATYSTTITVTNKPDAPTLTVTPPAGVTEEQAARVLVATASATDPDQDETLTYSLDAANPDAAFFAIAADGTISTAATLDFETQSSYTFDVVVTDKDGLQDAVSIAVAVLDINDPPVVTAGQVFTVEDSAGPGTALTTVPTPGGTPTVVYTDDENHGVTYSIVGGTGVPFFDFTAGTNDLELTTEIDFDDGSVYELEIIATDDGAPAASSAPETVTITVTSQFGDDVSPFFRDVVFNEVHYTSHETLGVFDTSEDFIEILNITGAPIDLTGWTLRDSPLFEDDANSTSTDLTGSTIAADGRLVKWLSSVERGLPAPTVELTTPLNVLDPRAAERSLQINDDLFLFDNNGLIVAYMAWGDDSAAGSEIGTRPPLETWQLWDPTFEGDLSFIARDSISATPDGENSSLSGCWERTASGNALANGNCQLGAALSNDTTLDPAVHGSPGWSNDVIQNSPTAADHLVISELAINGMVGGAEDNFIEIYNPTNFVYDLANVEFQLHIDGAVRIASAVSLPGLPTRYLGPGQSLVLGENDGSFDVDAGGSDVGIPIPMNSWDIGIRLRDIPTGNTIDQVGMRQANVKEGAGIQVPTLTTDPQSFQRRAGEGNGHCIDSGVNENDFFISPLGINPRRIIFAAPELCG